MAPPPWELSVTPKPSILEGLHWKLLGKGLLPVPPQLAAVRSVLPVGKPPKRVGSNGFCPWTSTPFDKTVIAAPSRAPISVGSCNISARLPLRRVAVKAFQPDPQAGAHPLGVPLRDNPIKQLTCRRQTSNLPAGWVFALMMLEAAPTPCSRTGFHMSKISLWVPAERIAPAVVHATAAPVV